MYNSKSIKNVFKKKGGKEVEVLSDKKSCPGCIMGWVEDRAWVGYGNGKGLGK